MLRFPFLKNFMSFLIDEINENNLKKLKYITEDDEIEIEYIFYINGVKYHDNEGDWFLVKLSENEREEFNTEFSEEEILDFLLNSDHISYNDEEVIIGSYKKSAMF